MAGVLILGEQRAWIQSKKLNCQQAAASADNAAQAEYLRLRVSHTRGAYVTDCDHIPSGMDTTRGLWTSEYFYREASKVGPGLLLLR